jgi:hypothetical protein
MGEVEYGEFSRLVVRYIWNAVSILLVKKVEGPSA